MTFVTGQVLTAAELNALDTRITRLEDRIVNVKSFGATGNGVTDDITAINAARDYLISLGGGILLFHPGDYKVSSELQILYPNVYILGCGVGNTRILASNVSQNIIRFGNGIVNLRDVGVAGLSLDKVSSITKTDGAAILVENTARFSIDSIDIYNNKDGIKFLGTTASAIHTGHITRVNIWNGVPTISNGIHIHNAIDLFFNQLVINGPAGDMSTGILITACQSAWFNQMDVLHADTGVNVLGNAADSTITWLFFETCAFDNCGNGIDVQTTHASALIKGVKFNQCWSSSNTLYGVNISGIDVARLDGVDLVDHVALNNGRHGANVSTSKNVRFNGGTYTGNSQELSNTYSGIQVNAGVSNFAIQNVKAGTSYIYPSTQYCGIRVVTGASDNYIITGNNLIGNISADLFDGGSGTNKVVENNITTTPVYKTNIALGAAPRGDINLYSTAPITGATTAYFIYTAGSIQASVTAAAYYFRSVNTVAASVSVGNIVSFQAGQGAFGAGSSVTAQTGFSVAASMTGATSNFGFKGDLVAAANTYNLYMGGTAANYLEGDIQLGKTITAAGTTGARTINKTSGSVNFAAGATSLVVTNSLVTTSSVINCTIGTNDTTMKSVVAVAASGSFTIYANAAATAETRVNFIITN